MGTAYTPFTSSLFPALERLEDIMEDYQRAQRLLENTAGQSQQIVEMADRIDQLSRLGANPSYRLSNTTINNLAAIQRQADFLDRSLRGPDILGSYIRGYQRAFDRLSKIQREAERISDLALQPSVHTSILPGSATEAALAGLPDSSPSAAATGRMSTTPARSTFEKNRPQSVEESIGVQENLEYIVEGQVDILRDLLDISEQVITNDRERMVFSVAVSYFVTPLLVDQPGIGDFLYTVSATWVVIAMLYHSISWASEFE